MSKTEQNTTPVNNLNEALPNQLAVLNPTSIVSNATTATFSMQELMTPHMAQFIPTEQQAATQMKPVFPVIEALI